MGPNVAVEVNCAPGTTAPDIDSLADLLPDEWDVVSVLPEDPSSVPEEPEERTYED